MSDKIENVDRELTTTEKLIRASAYGDGYRKGYEVGSAASRPGAPSCPHWGIDHSDGIEWVCSRPAPSPGTLCPFWESPIGDHGKGTCQFDYGDCRYPDDPGEWGDCLRKEKHDADIAAQAREKVLDALARDWKGRYVEDAVAEIRRFPESLRTEGGEH